MKQARIKAQQEALKKEEQKKSKKKAKDNEDDSSEGKSKEFHRLASTQDFGTNNCIQNFHLGRYIFGYMVGNLVLRDFRLNIRRYTSPNENFEYGYPHSNAFLQFCPQLDGYKLQKAACHPTICSVINDVILFPTVYPRIYCHKLWTLSNQTSRYKNQVHICIKAFFKHPYLCIIKQVSR